jgi:hypothetical protein
MDLGTVLLLAAWLPLGTFLGIAGYSVPPSGFAVAYELCLRVALLGMAGMAGILALGIPDAPHCEIFASIPLGLFLLEIGWVLGQPAPSASDD